MERDFEIGTRKFKLCKINAFEQFHIARRIAPILAELLPAMKDVVGVNKLGSSEVPESEKLDELVKIAAPIMNGLSKLSDVDSDKVLFGLLSAVEMQQAAGNWVRVSTKEMLMVQDLDLPVMLQLAGRAFVFNLSGFFAALPQKSP